MRRELLSLAVVAILMGPLCVVRADNAGMRVVVNSANALSSMSREEVSKFYLGKATKWPDGTTVAPVDLAGKTSTRRLFSQEILRKEIEAVESLWQQLIFSGKAIPPPAKPSEAEVVAFVKGNAGGIGYVSYSTDLGSGVKEFAIK
ncbi:MAG: hypothetical protein ABIP62_00210 [Vicinamibacteria bacterium]